MRLRLANKEDLLGILDCLEVLSDVSFTSWLDVEKAFDEREAAGNVVTFVVVAESIHSHYGNTNDEFVMGTASVFIQRKLSHGGKSVAFIDDVAVRQDCQGLGVGILLVESCVDYAKSVGCYKAILDCSDDNIGYYERLGFKQSGQGQMRMDL